MLAARRAAPCLPRPRPEHALSTHDRGVTTLAVPLLRFAASHLLALRSGFIYLRARQRDRAAVDQGRAVLGLQLELHRTDAGLPDRFGRGHSPDLVHDLGFFEASSISIWGCGPSGPPCLLRRSSEAACSRTPPRSIGVSCRQACRASGGRQSHAPPPHAPYCSPCSEASASPSA